MNDSEFARVLAEAIIPNPLAAICRVTGQDPNAMPWRPDLRMYATDEAYARIRDELSKPRAPDLPGTYRGIPMRDGP